MALFRNIQTLLAMAEAKTQNQASPAYRVVASPADETTDTNQLFRVFFSVTQTGGVTSPTTDVNLETSWDGSSWIKVIGSTQLTADGTTHEWKEAAAIGPWVRATTSLGGATKPSHLVTVKLASSAPFKLRTE
jgi:hypothetical protein